MTTTTAKTDLVPQRPKPLRSRPWAIIALAVALALLAYYATLGIRYWQVSREAAELRGRVADLSSASSPSSADYGMLEQRTEASLQLDQLRNAFDYPAPDALLGLVTSTASEAGIAVTSIIAGDPSDAIVEGVKYQKVLVTVTAQGDTASFYQFMMLLQRKVGAVAVAGIGFAGLDGGTTAQIPLLFYLSPQLTPKDQ